MNNEIILSALETQLATKKAERDSYETLISEPAYKAITQEVLDALYENVSNLIPSITLTSDRIEVMKNSQRWSSVTIYLENDWRSEDKSLFAKMNWYGSSATTKEENVLNDVQIFGAVAAKLSWIEYEFINVWRPSLIEITKPIDEMRSEIYKIESSIRDIKNKIRQDGISSYKKEGFSCIVIPALTIETDWQAEGRPYILKESMANGHIQLSLGRSKWDYVYPKSFKVVKTNKYKTTLQVTFADNEVVERTVTAKSFDQFIDQVYDWQTQRAKDHNDKTTEKFNTHYATK